MIYLFYTSKQAGEAMMWSPFMLVLRKKEVGGNDTEIPLVLSQVGSGSWKLSGLFCP